MMHCAFTLLPESWPQTSRNWIEYRIERIVLPLFAVEPVCLPTSWKPSKTVRSRLSFSAGSSLQALTDELA